MIKDFLFTMMLNENSMEKIYRINRKIYFIIFAITNILFPILFNIFLCVTVKNYSFIDYFFISLSEIKDNLFFNILLFAFLFAIFYVQSNGTKYFELMVKTVIAMNFIHPFVAVITHYLSNLIFDLIFILYDIVFVKFFIGKNISDENLSKKRQFGCVIATFLILLIIYGFVYKILLLN